MARVRLVPGPLIATNQWCDKSGPSAPCSNEQKCADGYACVDRWCQPRWVADCKGRCAPPEPDLAVCHGNEEIHAMANAPDLLYLSTFEPAEVSGCAEGGAFRIWSVPGRDQRTPDQMDENEFSSWRARNDSATSTRCLKQPPTGFYVTRFHHDNPGPAYLLRSEREVIPAE